MDVRTEQAYQQRIAALEACVVDLKTQLAQRDATIAALQQQVTDLSKQVVDLLAQVARLSKNSSNSSKPPSSDIVKPPPPPPGEKRSIGGQKGHSRHQREPFTPAQINRVVDYQMDCCPNCGGQMRPLHQPPRKLQQVEIPEVPVEVLEHRRHGYFCPHCQKGHDAPLPPEIQNSGLVGPRLTTWIAYLKGSCHCSFSTIRHFCRDVLHLPISRGQLAKVIQKASTAMAESHLALQRMLEGLRRLFHVIHQRETMAALVFRQALEDARDDLVVAGLDAPEYKPAQNMAKRFDQNGESYFRFITTPGLEPTNNLAEQAIRFVVLDRHVTQGTRSERGQKWCERIWTAIATCSQQQRSVFEFLYQTVNNHFAGKPTPSLLPSGP